jgi:hypothetical protein
MEKPIAAFLQAGAGFMLYAAGAFGGDAVLLIAPALASGAAGLWLWGRSARTVLPGRTSQTVLSATDQDPDAALRSLQEEVAQLREDRAFYQELYSGGMQRQADQQIKPRPGDLA